jgi:hypothetical protein
MDPTVKSAGIILIVTLLLGVAMGAGFFRAYAVNEGFYGGGCNRCNQNPCACGGGGGGLIVGNAYRGPDMSKYVLKSTIPPCAQCPDLSNYMLKTECPPAPDLSKYILKSSVPKPQPVIIDSSACSKEQGECPPCPRPRCPQVQCPAPTKCPPPAPCPRPVCPPTTVKCKAEESTASTVRPFLAPLNFGTFGTS